MAKPPPLMGGDKGEGDQTFYHPHLTSPIKGEELHSNPVAPICRDLHFASTSYRELSKKQSLAQTPGPDLAQEGYLYAPKNQNHAEIALCSYLVAPGQAVSPYALMESHACRRSEHNSIFKSCRTRRAYCNFKLLEIASLRPACRPAGRSQ